MGEQPRSKAATDTLLKELKQCGYVLMEGAGQSGLDSVIAQLGEVIQVTKVHNNPDTPALVTSDRALDFHTDHPKADFIVWLCVEQSQTGGESILADADMAFERLSPDDQAALKEIRLFEHKVFPDDEDSRPLVSTGAGGKRRFYYSFWLVKGELPSAQKSALKCFQAAVSECQVAEIKLRRDDVLIVDNGRILHGRRAFTGGNRLLIRHWVCKI